MMERRRGHLPGGNPKHRERVDDLHKKLLGAPLFRFKPSAQGKVKDIVGYCNNLVKFFDEEWRTNEGKRFGELYMKTFINSKKSESSEHKDMEKILKSPEELVKSGAGTDYQIVVDRIRKLGEMGVDVKKTAETGQLVFKE